MKRHEILFGAIKLPIEFTIIFFSFFIARSMRLVSDFIPGVFIPTKTIATTNLINFALLGAFLFVFIFTFSGLYKIKTTSSRLKEFFDIITNGFTWFVFYITILYLSNGYLYNTEIPRLIIFFTLLISIFFIIFERFFLYKIQNILLEKGLLQKTRILLIIKNNEVELLEDLKNSAIYEVVGYINNKKISSIHLPYIGDKNKFYKQIQDLKIDEILLVNSDFSQDELEQIFEYSRIYGVSYKYIANFFDISKNNTETSFLNKFPIVEIKSIGLNPWGRVMKRTIDVIVSIISIIILIIPMFVIAILIKLEDPDGPVIFKNRRVGKNGEFFDVYKFRYMKWEFCVKDAYGIDPEKDKALKLEKKLIKERNSRQGPLYKIKNDPRKMKIGKFIERFSIDELPQLLNVFIGNMSLIGPRPHQPREVALYKEYQKRVLTIKPGITGMGQVHGRHENTFDDEVRLDTFYIENWSLLLDLKIFLKTITTVIKR